MSYERDRAGYVKVFTDGSCKNNGLSNPSAGIGVWFGANSILNVSKPVRGPATNNNAEIQALTEAFRVAKQQNFDKIRIYTDSEFAYNAITSWIDTWKANGWKTSTGEPVANKESLQECDNARRAWGGCFEIELVRGHAGNRGNEGADRLAREGADLY